MCSSIGPYSDLCCTHTNCLLGVKRKFTFSYENLLCERSLTFSVLWLQGKKTVLKKTQTKSKPGILCMMCLFFSPLEVEQWLPGMACLLYWGLLTGIFLLCWTVLILPAWRSAVSMTRRERISFHGEITVFIEHLQLKPKFKVIATRAICTKYYGAQHHINAENGLQYVTICMCVCIYIMCYLGYKACSVGS